jgi:fibronectin-binding autotransporter adhesin
VIASYSSLGTSGLFTNNAGALTFSTDSSATTGTNVVLSLSGSSASYTNLSTISLRFYGYNSETTAGTGGLQAPLTFNGSLTAPPAFYLYWDAGTWTGTGPGTGGSGLWSDGTGGWDSAKTADFGGTGNAVTVGGVTAAKGLTFSSTGYTLAGGTITMSGSSSSPNTITTGSDTSVTATIDSVLAGSGGLTKAGAGALVLGGANTLTGGLAINGGTLQIAANSALGDTANDISFAAGTLKTTASVSMGSGRDVTGGGTLDIAPGTTLTSSGSFNLSSTTLANSGTLDLQGATRSVGVLTFGAAGAVNGSGAISASGLTATNVTSGSAIINPAITFTSGDKTVDVGSGGTLVLNGDIAGTTGRILKTGAGTLVASGSNSTSGYRLGASGASPTNGGTLILAAAAASGTATQLQVNYGTLQAAAPSTFTNGLSIGGRTGAVAVIGGTAATTFSGSTSFFRPTATSGELRLDVNNATILSGTIGATSGGGSATGITLGGTGSLTLNGGAALTEAITLQDSLDFVVNNALAGSVNVANGTLLSGTGTIAGAVSVLGGGIVAPGTSPGTLTVNNIFSLAGTSVLEFELNAADQTVGSGVNDLIAGVTNLTLDGVLNVSGSGDFTAIVAPATWRLFNYSGILTNNTLTLGSTPTLAAGQSFTLDTATSGQVNLVVIPEPGSVALAGIGLAAAAWATRRKWLRTAN